MHEFREVMGGVGGVYHEDHLAALTLNEIASQ